MSKKGKKKEVFFFIIALSFFILQGCSSTKKPKKEHPVFACSASHLNFGASVTSMPLTISNTGKSTLRWSINHDQKWLTVTPSQGETAPGSGFTVTASVVRGCLDGGTYQGMITVNSDGGSRSVSAQMKVVPHLSISSEALDFGTSLESQSLIIANTGWGTSRWSIDGDQEWLMITPHQGETCTETDTVEVSVERDGLPHGEYSGKIHIYADGEDKTLALTIQVTDGKTVSLQPPHHAKIKNVEKAKVVGKDKKEHPSSPPPSPPSAVTPYDQEKSKQDKNFLNPSPNHPPEITFPPSYGSASLGILYTCKVDANDPDHDTLHYSLISAPPGMSIDPDTGTITWMPTSQGDYQVRVALTDGKYPIERAFVISVPGEEMMDEDIPIRSAAKVKVRTGFNLDWWEREAKPRTNIGNLTEKKALRGSQITIPIKVETYYRELSLSILSGYVKTNTTLSKGGGEPYIRYLTTPLDTKLNLDYKMLSQSLVDTLLGLDVNLPTGKTGLSNFDLIYMANPDLVSVTKFGEGFNLNPTFNLTKEWSDRTAGIGIGYVWRGKYEVNSKIKDTDPDEIKDYDPGDISNFTMDFGYDFLADYQFRLFGNYVYSGKDRINGKDEYQEGDFLLVGIQCGYRQPQWDGEFTVQSELRGKSKVESKEKRIEPVIYSEKRNSHGDEWIADLSFRYYLDERTRLRSCFDFLWNDKNDYPADDPLFFGEKQKLSLMFGVTTLIGRSLEGELQVKGFLLREEKNWFHPDEQDDYQGISTGFKLTASF